MDVARADKYESFAQLDRHEVHGRDFRVRIIPRPQSPVVVIAPHGGGIEIGTSELAFRIARARHSLFLFEGLKPAWENRCLHITSHRFDHPECISLVSRSLVTLTVHGCKGDSQIFIGGLDEDLKMRLAERFRAAGFPACTEGHRYPGRNPMNICNRGLLGRGAQLELTRDLRTPAARKALAPLVRDALTEHVSKISRALRACRSTPPFTA